MLRLRARGQKCDPSLLWQTPLWREDQLEIHLGLAVQVAYWERYRLTTDSDRQLPENLQAAFYSRVDIILLPR